MTPDASATTWTPPTCYRGERALVLGGAGFIGRWVTQALVETGAEVHVAARSAAGARGVLEPQGVQAIVHAADLAAPGVVADVIAAVAPAVCFNLAGYGVDPTERDPDIARRLNAGIVEDLAAALARAPRRGAVPQCLVHVGSALEYGNAGGPLAEDGPALPDTLYGRTKLAGTRAVEAAGAAHGLRALTARLFTVFGPGEHAGRLLPTLIAAAPGTDSIPLTAGSQRRDFAFVEDVARALVSLGAAAAAPGAIVNVATGTLTSVRSFIELAARVLGIAPARLAFGALPTRGEEMRHEPVAVARMRALIGAALSDDLERGIRRAIAGMANAPAGATRRGGFAAPSGAAP